MDRLICICNSADVFGVTGKVHMGLSETLISIRERIEADLPSAEKDPASHFFGPAIFSPVTEVAVCLLKVLRKATGTVPDHEAFRRHFLTLLASEHPGRLAVELWGLARLDAVRIDTLLSGKRQLLEAFNHLVLTPDELKALSTEEVVALLYRLYLDRVPDPQGLRDWSGQIKSGASVNAVAEALRTSDEGKQRATGRSLSVIEAKSQLPEGLLRSYRQLQDLELSRVYDFARLLVLIGD